MVRARVCGHLEALKARFPDLLGGCEILDSGGTDYAYRLFVAKPAWMQVVAELADDGDGDDDVEEEGEAERDTEDTTEEGRVTAAELPMLFEIPRPQTPLVLQ